MGLHKIQIHQFHFNLKFLYSARLGTSIRYFETFIKTNNFICEIFEKASQKVVNFFVKGHKFIKISND